MKKTSLTLRALSALIGYPGAELRAHLGELKAALHDAAALPAARLAELDALIDRLRRGRGFDAESAYVEVFDRGRGTALHLFEHVHGDSRERGPAMIDLIRTYEAAGLRFGEGELPDHLSVVLEYASTQPPAQARAFLREFAHILQAIFSALLRRESPYASVLAALLDLAGEKAPAVKLPSPPEGVESTQGGPAPTDEPTLDEEWQEPLAFGGCSTQGQASPGQPQPIQIVRRPAATSSSLTGARP
jgi:nitrate reductase molybdenum cofactor assembly chaperone NarJ/NarW